MLVLLLIISTLNLQCCFSDHKSLLLLLLLFVCSFIQICLRRNLFVVSLWDDLLCRIWVRWLGIFCKAASLVVERSLSESGWERGLLVRLPERYLLLIYRRLSVALLSFVCIVITVINFINNIFIIVPAFVVIDGSSWLSVVSIILSSQWMTNFLIRLQLLQGTRSFLRIYDRCC